MQNSSQQQNYQNKSTYISDSDLSDCRSNSNSNSISTFCDPKNIQTKSVVSQSSQNQSLFTLPQFQSFSQNHRSGQFATTTQFSIFDKFNNNVLQDLSQSQWDDDKKDGKYQKNFKRSNSHGKTSYYQQTQKNYNYNPVAQKQEINTNQKSSQHNNNLKKASEQIVHWSERSHSISHYKVLKKQKNGTERIILQTVRYSTTQNKFNLEQILLYKFKKKRLSLSLTNVQKKLLQQVLHIIKGIEQLTFIQGYESIEHIYNKQKIAYKCSPMTKLELKSLSNLKIIIIYKCKFLTQITLAKFQNLQSLSFIQLKIIKLKLQQMLTLTQLKINDCRLLQTVDIKFCNCQVQALINQFAINNDNVKFFKC